MIILVRHLRRSGSHAIINWLMNHFENITFFNNIEENGKTNGKEVRGTGLDNTIYNIENKSKDIRFNGNKPNKKIIIIRDPLNWISSILKRVDNLSFGYDNGRVEGKQCLKLYKEYYDMYKSDKYYGINYNKWFSDESYRRQIEKDLNLIETDEGINQVKNYGRGSSFDGRKFNGNATQMKTNERWFEYKDRKEIKMVLEDPFFIDILENDFDIKI